MKPGTLCNQLVRRDKLGEIENLLETPFSKMTEANSPSTKGVRTFRPHFQGREAFGCRLGESHYHLCQGVSNLKVHPIVPGTVPNVR
jgi:hypothetical protein